VLAVVVTGLDLEIVPRRFPGDGDPWRSPLDPFPFARSVSVDGVVGVGNPGIDRKVPVADALPRCGEAVGGIDLAGVEVGSSDPLLPLV
jgi:hypothetical protein